MAFDDSFNSETLATQPYDFVPLDLRLGMTKPLRSKENEGKLLNWGIVGAGRVCHDFVQALKVVPGAVAYGVAARDKSRAETFGKKHNIKQAYNSYEELCSVKEIDIIYIGTVQSEHLKHAMLALSNNKHVIVEKPAGLDAAEVEEMVRMARSKKLFFMEGMWTRFFPVVEIARRVIFELSEIGEVEALMSDFGFNSFEHEKYPESPMYDSKLGGGALLYVGCYPLATIPFAFKLQSADMPDRLVAAGRYDYKLGVDMNGSISARFGSQIATLYYGLTAETAEETTIVGNKGRVVVHTPAHCPTRMTVFRKIHGRGNVEPVVFDIKLPEFTDEIKAAGGFVYPNSFGFQYEAAAIQRCIFAGLTECPQYTPDETILVARMMQRARELIKDQ